MNLSDRVKKMGTVNDTHSITEKQLKNLMENHALIYHYLKNLKRYHLLVAVLGVLLAVVTTVFYFKGKTELIYDEKYGDLNDLTDLSPKNFGSIEPIWVCLWTVSFVMMTFLSSKLLLRNEMHKETLNKITIWIIKHFCVIIFVITVWLYLVKLGYLEFNFLTTVVLLGLVSLEIVSIGLVVLYCGILLECSASFDRTNGWCSKFICFLVRGCRQWIEVVKNFDRGKMEVNVFMRRQALQGTAHFDMVIAVGGLVSFLVQVGYFFVAKMRSGSEAHVDFIIIDDLTPKDFDFTEAVLIYIFVEPCIIMSLVGSALLLKYALRAGRGFYKVIRTVAWWIILNIFFIVLEFGLVVSAWFIYSWVHIVFCFCMVLYRLRFMALVLRYTSEVKVINAVFITGAWYFVLTSKLELPVFIGSTENNNLVKCKHSNCIQI